jgi:hypothetical protein
VAITTSFGSTKLIYFYDDSFEVDAKETEIRYPKNTAQPPSQLAIVESNMPTQTNASQAYSDASRNHLRQHNSSKTSD